jgi:hypothetical protein
MLARMIRVASFAFGLALAAPLLQAAMPGTPAAKSQYTTEFSHSFDAPLARGDLDLGDLNTTTVRLGYLHTQPLAEAWDARVGLEWQRFDFGTPAMTPIPDSVQAVALRLGLNWRFAPAWTAMVEIAPGLYTDFEDIGGSDANVPGGILFTWEQNPALTWMFGLRYDPYSEIPVIPGVGLRWRIDEQWTLSLVMPRPRIEYALTPEVTLFAGGDYRGGGFRVAEDFGRRAGDPRLDDEILSYRELRAGAGLRVGLAERIHAVIEGGWVIDRRFVYDDPKLQLNGEGTPYVQVGISGSY